jgi:adenylate cyclase class 2
MSSQFAMLEVEIKFPVEDLSALEDGLKGQGAEFKSRRQESDYYNNAPHRDFARTDEALRVRQTNESNYVTYKGPKRDSDTKTREEIEVPLASGHLVAADMVKLFETIGFRHVAVIEKWRSQYRLKWKGFEVVIALDRVQDVGDYAELEIMAPEDQYEAARAAVMQLAKDLGLAQPERRSYLELWLEKHGSKS